MYIICTFTLIEQFIKKEFIKIMISLKVGLR